MIGFESLLCSFTGKIFCCLELNCFFFCFFLQILIFELALKQGILIGLKQVMFNVPLDAGTVGEGGSVDRRRP